MGSLLLVETYQAALDTEGVVVFWRDDRAVVALGDLILRRRPLIREDPQDLRVLRSEAQLVDHDIATSTDDAGDVLVAVCAPAGCAERFGHGVVIEEGPDAAPTTVAGDAVAASALSLLPLLSLAPAVEHAPGPEVPAHPGPHGICHAPTPNAGDETEVVRGRVGCTVRYVAHQAGTFSGFAGSLAGSLTGSLRSGSGCPL